MYFKVKNILTFLPFVVYILSTVNLKSYSFFRFFSISRLMKVLEVVRFVEYYFIFTVFLIASVYDYLFQKIPNKFVVWTLVNGIFLNLFIGNRVTCILMVFIAFLVAFPFYLVKAVGAGDVKIFSVVSLFLTGEGVLKLWGLALICVLAYGLLYKLVRHKRGRTRVPMAPAMLLGTGILVWMGGF